MAVIFTLCPLCLFETSTLTFKSYRYVCMQAPSGNEVDDVIRDLKKISGFSAYVILNNDGTTIIKFACVEHKSPKLIL